MVVIVMEVNLSLICSGVCLTMHAGRTVTIRLSRSGDYSLLLELAVEVAFDWVYYAANDFIQLSVIPTSMLIFQYSELWTQIGGE